MNLKDEAFKHDISRCTNINIKYMLRDTTYEEMVTTASAYIKGAQEIAEALGVELEWNAGIAKFDIGYVTFKIGFLGDKNG